MSTIPAVLAALATLGEATLTSSQVINGPYTSVTTTTGRVFVIAGDERLIVGERQLDSMSGTTTSETCVVPLTVSVSISGTDQTAADAQAIADYEAFELAAREFSGGADLGLSASGVLSVLPIGEFEMSRFASENGRSTAIRFSVAVIAQNT